jgi:hypothetical protein
VIKTIEIEGFKSLEKVRLELGGLNLFIGANASGKSNFFDALRVLQGIGYGFTVDEIFNGKPKGASSEVWEGIRGGSAQAAYARRHVRDSASSRVAAMRFSLCIQTSPPHAFVYENVIVATEGIIQKESLFDRGILLFDVSADARVSMLLDHWMYFNHEEDVGSFLRALVNMQRVDPSPEILRQYSQSRSAQRLGERGENFAALVKSVLADDDLRSAYLSWLRQLTPLELDDVTILEGALGEPLFALKEGNETLPAPILSDGTLRFAAMTAAFFQSDMPSIITIEEIENGIHPSRLRLLIELLKSQTCGTDLQVFATTHSPVVLAWLDEEDYKTTFLCRRDAESGASIITPLSEIPHLIELVRKQPIGELFTEGWLEGAF